MKKSLIVWNHRDKDLKVSASYSRIAWGELSSRKHLIVLNLAMLFFTLVVSKTLITLKGLGEGKLENTSSKGTHFQHRAISPGEPSHQHRLLTSVLTFNVSDCLCQHYICQR